MRDVNQDARSEGHLVEGEAIAPQRGFRFRATDQVVPGPLREATAGFPNEFLVTDDVESQATRPPMLVVSPRIVPGGDVILPVLILPVLGYVILSLRRILNSAAETADPSLRSG
jgi:hypothetical protein